MKRVFAAVALLAVIVIAWRALRDDGSPSAPRARDTATAIEPARAPKVTKRGAARDDEASRQEEDAPKKKASRAGLPPGVVVVDAHPVHPIEVQSEANRASVEEAKKSGRHPERLDPKVAPAPFDRAGYDRDPQAYLDVVEPGRVWQTADEGSGRDALEADGPVDFSIAPRGRAKIAVRGEPSSPVTFTIMGGGELGNGLTSMTVRADPTGFARASFTASGDDEEVTIVAGSPYNVGQVNFTIRIGAR